jgi:hypothetical protein
MSERDTRRAPSADAEAGADEDGPDDRDLLELAGTLPQSEQGAAVPERYADRLGEPTDTEIYEGELEAGVTEELLTEPDQQNLEMLAERELRGDETDNPDVAAEEGMTYVPPTDPPVIADAEAEDGVAVAAGFGGTALDEPYDEDHHSEILDSDQEMHDRIHEALRADATTSPLADQIVVGTKGGKVVLRGVVEDLIDAENAVAVAERADGVVEVIDEIEVRALDR